jgi:radical SAM protein with 4Fe4S-binding SPASM domain
MFSIIMPVRNRADQVSRAIDSVLAQTFSDYELLVIDSSSGVKLKQIVAPYLCEKIMYHPISGCGLAAVRNAGLQKAQKSFIAYLDPDHVWHPEFLARMRDVLRGSTTAYEAAYCMADLCQQDPATGKILRHGMSGQSFDFKTLLTSDSIDINTFVHSRKALEFAGQFNEKFKHQADWDIIIRITSLFEPAFVEETLVDHYTNSRDGKSKSAGGFNLPWRTVGIKHVGFTEPIVFVHDAIEYTWENMPKEKYINWVRMHHQQLNTADYTAWGYPFMVQIEPTNVCNLKCPLCPAGQGRLNRKAQHMPLATYKGIIDDMEKYLMFLVLWDWGEPFIHPDFPEMIRYASERDIRTVTSTNAQFLKDQGYVEAILKSGLSTLIVAVDSACDHIYESYRKGGSFDQTIRGLQNLVETKKRIGSKTLINMRMVIMKSNEHELSKIRRLARQLGVDWFSVKTAHINYDDPTPDSEAVARDPKYRFYEYKSGTYERIRVDIKCRKCWEMATIYSNGDVVPCCYDFDGTLKKGNVLEQPLTKLWNSPVYQEFRKKVYHQMQSMPLCKVCEINYKLSKTGWFSESHLVKYIEQLQWYFRKPLGRRMLQAAKDKCYNISRVLDSVESRK